MTVGSGARAYLRELESLDERLAAELVELDELARQAESVRGRAREVAAFLERLPAEREARRLAVVDAEGGAAEATRAREAAQRALADAEGTRGVSLDEARRALQIAEDGNTITRRQLADARAALGALDREAAAVEVEAPGLNARVAEIAAALRGRSKLPPEVGPPPSPGFAGIEHWGGTVRAALFVARSALAAERAAVVRQANELGSSLLGEPLGAVSAAAVARRLDPRLRD